MHAVACPLLSTSFLERPYPSWNQTISHDLDAQMAVCAMKRENVVFSYVEAILVVVEQFLNAVNVIRFTDYQWFAR